MEYLFAIEGEGVIPPHLAEHLKPVSDLDYLRFTGATSRSGISRRVGISVIAPTEPDLDEWMSHGWSLSTITVIRA